MQKLSISPDEFKKYIRLGTGLAASLFVMESDVKGDKAFVKYYANYEEFEKHNPHTSIRKEKFSDYFDDPSQIEVMLLREPARIFKNIPQINEVELFIPLDGKYCHLRVSRNEMESFFKVDFNKLSQSDMAWIRFVDKYCFKSKTRKNFIMRFTESMEKGN